MKKITKNYVKDKIEKLVDEIDNYLYELEREDKDNSNKYEYLLYISGGLRELLEVEI